MVRQVQKETRSEVKKNLRRESEMLLWKMSISGKMKCYRMILEEYEAENVYNADEFGLFYNILPNRSLVHKSEECKGSKLKKDRLTVLVAANSTRTDKITPLVIGETRETSPNQLTPPTVKSFSGGWDL